MPPFYDWLCMSCGHEFSERADFETRKTECPHCETTTAERLPPLCSYSGNMGTGSTRPKKTASNSGKKVFTGNDKTEEPEQLEFDFDRGIK